MMLQYIRHARLATLLVAFLVTFLSLGAPSAHAATLGCADDATGVTDREAWVGDMLAATNAHRTGMGLVALQLDPTLTRASTWKARDLARRNYFAHDDPASGAAPARTPWERLTECGFTSGGSRAENIAAGQKSGAEVIQAWLNSPGHRANIENGALRYVGFAVAYSSSSTYGTYAVQMFSSVPGPVAPAPATPPAAPTMTTLELAYDDVARFVCPPTAPTGVTFELVSADGVIDATRTSDGCLRIAPVPDAGATAATISYFARGAGGLTSATVQLRVTVSPLTRTLLEETTPPAAQHTSIVATSARVTRRRCSSALAVGGWCWSLVVRGRVLVDGGIAAAGRSVVVTRRSASGRLIPAGRSTSNADGTFRSVTAIRPSVHSTSTWLARNVSRLRIGVAASPMASSAVVSIAVRR